MTNDQFNTILKALLNMSFLMGYLGSDLSDEDPHLKEKLVVFDKNLSAALETLLEV